MIVVMFVYIYERNSPKCYQWRTWVPTLKDSAKCLIQQMKTQPQQGRICDISATGEKEKNLNPAGGRVGMG